jgi:hypothetical protein
MKCERKKRESLELSDVHSQHKQFTAVDDFNICIGRCRVEAAYCFKLRWTTELDNNSALFSVDVFDKTNTNSLQDLEALGIARRTLVRLLSGREGEVARETQKAQRSREEPIDISGACVCGKPHTVSSFLEFRISPQNRTECSGTCVGSQPSIPQEVCASPRYPQADYTVEWDVRHSLGPRASNL